MTASVTWGDWLARPSPKHDAADIEAECPLCGEPASITWEITEDGLEWQGSCIDCNTRFEVQS